MAMRVEYQQSLDALEASLQEMGEVALRAVRGAVNALQSDGTPIVAGATAAATSPASGTLTFSRSCPSRRHVQSRRAFMGRRASLPPVYGSACAVAAMAWASSASHRRVLRP